MVREMVVDCVIVTLEMRVPNLDIHPDRPASISENFSTWPMELYDPADTLFHPIF